MAANDQTHSRTVRQVLQNYCDVFGHPKVTIWDRYDSTDRKALVHKLKFIFGAPSERVVDADNNPAFADADALNSDLAMIAQVYDRNANESEENAKMVCVDSSCLETVAYYIHTWINIFDFISGSFISENYRCDLESK